MKKGEIRALLHTEPFRPFTLFLADGRRLLVEHPDFVALSPDLESMFVYKLDGSFSIIDLEHAVETSVEKKGRRKEVAR